MFKTKKKQRSLRRRENSTNALQDITALIIEGTRKDTLSPILRDRGKADIV